MCGYGQVLLQIRNLGEEKVKEKKETNWKLCRYGKVIPAFEKFGETLMPILAKMGIAEAKPEILPVHYEVFGTVEV